MLLLSALLVLFAANSANAAGCTEAQYSKFTAAIEQHDNSAISSLSKSTDCLKSTKQKNLLAFTAEKSDLPTFTALLEAGADVNLRTISDGLCHYQILHVIQGLRKEDPFSFVKALVDAGADLQSCATDNSGACGENVCDTDKLPIGQAAERGDIDSVNYLADHKARISGDELFYSSPDKARITERLLELGANPTISDNSPLFRTHSAEAVKLLVKAGADINFRQFGYGKAVPLAIYSKPEVFLIDPVIAAIDAGADLRIPMTLGSSWPCAGLSAMLCWASQLSPTSLIAMYHGLKFSRLIDLEQRDAEGQTALMRLSRYYMYRAGRNMKTEVVQLLIAKGANLNATDKDGKNVLAYFKEYPRENSKEIAMLVAAGAKLPF